MVIVNAKDSIIARIQAEKDNAASQIKMEEILEYLKKTDQLKEVNLDEKYVYETGNVKKNQGFFMDGILKDNLDKFLVRAVDNKWDGIFLVTGNEGSGKSTIAASICKYLDPTFPGEPIGDGTARRHPDRVVFTPAQFSEAIAKSKPKQAIQFDEAILGLMAGDAGMNVQRMLMKEITLIRKKQLYIALVIPSIFSMRMPIAAQRSRFLIHTYSPDGIERGFFKFYNYRTKRQLYMKGKKDFNQEAVEKDFRGAFMDTEGLFYKHAEYDHKKETAIRNLTMESMNKKGNGGRDDFNNYKTAGQRNLLLYYIYIILEGGLTGKVHLEHLVKLHNQYGTVTNSKEKLSVNKYRDWLEQVFGEHLKLSEHSIRAFLKDAVEYTSKPVEPLIDENEKEEKEYETIEPPIGKARKKDSNDIL